MNHTSNNFDFLRFFAASLVVFSHCYPLTGRNEILASAIGHETGGGLAVSIFFIISGYLITASFRQSASTMEYLWKRILRIYPGFLVSILFCACVVGPWATTLSLGGYFTNPGFWGFFRNVSLYEIQWPLPGVFETNPHTEVDGTYWTLPIEFSMYLAIAAIGMLGRLTARTSLAAALLLYTAHLFFVLPSPSLLNMPLFFVTLYGALFMAGSALYLWQDKIDWDWRIFLLLLFVTLACITRKEGNLILYLCLPYLIIWLARFPLPFFSRFARYGDFSYGIYLYGFPVQQSLIYYFGRDIPVASLFFLTMMVTLIFAFFSWHLVESPMLRLKKRLPLGAEKRPRPLAEGTAG